MQGLYAMTKPAARPQGPRRSVESSILTDEDKEAVEEYRQFRKMRRSLENIYMLARRKNRKAGNHSEAWGHIIRFCEEAGIRSSILRDQQRAPTAGAREKS